MTRPTHRRRHPTARLGVALVAVTLVLSSCTGDDDTDLDEQRDEQGSTAPDDPDAQPEIEHQLTIMLCDDRLCSYPTDEQIDDLRARLDADDDIVSARFESQEEAYERFVEMFEDMPDLTDAIDADTLPASFRVTLHSGADPAAFVERYEVLPGVDAVDWIGDGTELRVVD